MELRLNGKAKMITFFGRKSIAVRAGALQVAGLE